MWRRWLLALASCRRSAARSAQTGGLGARAMAVVGRPVARPAAGVAGQLPVVTGVAGGARGGGSGAGLATLAVVKAGRDAIAEARKALAAKVDGIVLDGDFPEAAVGRHPRRRPVAATVVELTSRSRMKLGSRTRRSSGRTRRYGRAFRCRTTGTRRPARRDRRGSTRNRLHPGGAGVGQGGPVARERAAGADRRDRRAVLAGDRRCGDLGGAMGGRIRCGFRGAAAGSARRTP